MTKKIFKAHFVTIFYLIRSYWLVFTAPLVRIVVQYVIYKDARLVLPAEIVILVLAVLVAIIGWLSIKIVITNRNVMVKRGFLLKSCITIDFSQLSSVSTSQNAFHIILGCVKCYLNTSAKKEKGLEVMLSASDATQLYNLVYSKPSTAPVNRQNKAKRFLAIPLGIFVVIVAVAVRMIVFSKGSQNNPSIMAVFLFVDLCYIGISYYDYKKGKLCLEENIFAKSVSVLNLRNFCCNKNKVGVVKISQNPFDRRYNTCKIKILGWGENGNSIKVKHIRQKEAIKRIAQVFNININV